ncbi:MAG: hypothetical protein AMXMBFR7_03690 [Planctomycetota bacterium]
MPTTDLHPLEAKFVKLALIRQLIKPSQLRRCHQIHAHRAELGEAVTLEQIMQEEGLITEDECNELWESIAQTGDTKFRQEVSSRRESRTRLTPAVRGTPQPAVARSRFGDVPEKIGGFEILEWIGSGGMGKVYKARQVAMDRIVALKLLPPDLARNAKYIRRFIREARAAGILNHGNLVRVHDVGEDDGRYYISMEYVEGRTVKQMIRREGRVPFLQALYIIEQVAMALDCAHQHKIVHRDIKPDNIMLTPQGQVKLCDLGLAKVLEGNLQDTDTQDGNTMGTPHYMSPEQAKAAGNVDARSDLFSLGSTLYHMVTGKVPFDGDSPWEILMKVINDEPARPDRSEPLLPPPYAKLILRLMAKNPADRPQTAEEVRRTARTLRKDLEAGRVFVFDDAPRALKGQPLPGPDEMARLKRRPWLIGLAAAAVLAMLAILTGGRPGGVPAPLPEQAYFPAPARSTADEPAEAKPPAVADVQPAAPPEIPAPPTTPLLAADWSVLREMERRLDQDPTQWNVLLARAEALQGALAQAGAADRERFEKLKLRLGEARDAEARAELERRRASGQVLWRAGHFGRAAQLLEDLPPLLRGGKEIGSALQGALEEVREALNADLAARRELLKGWIREGLLGLAARECQQWEEELRLDSAPPGDVRKLALVDLQAELTQATGARDERERKFERIRDDVRRGLESVRLLSRTHRLPAALAAAEGLLAQANQPHERLAYEAEILRLKLVRDLFTALSRTLFEHKNIIDAAEFMTQPIETGRVLDMDETHLVFSLARGGVAKLDLEKVSRREMRRLLDLVTADRGWMDNLALPRLAYDLEDEWAFSARLQISNRSVYDALAQELLSKLVESERPASRSAGRDGMLEAERLAVDGHYEEAQFAVVEALESLRRAEDGALRQRAQTLLEYCAAARERGSLFGGRHVLLSRNRERLNLSAEQLLAPEAGWSWQGQQPVLNPENQTIRFAAPGKGFPAWTLTAPALLVLEVQNPPQGLGAVSLSATGLEGGAPWILQAEQSRTDARATLSRGNAGDRPERHAAFMPGIRQRLWLRLHVGFASWGVEDQVLGVLPASTETGWRIELIARGEIGIRSLRVEGTLATIRTPEEREKEGRQALDTLREQPIYVQIVDGEKLYRQYSAHAALGSSIAANLAKNCARRGETAAALSWTRRALYACPMRFWPRETTLLYDGYLAYLSKVETLGRAVGNTEEAPPKPVQAPVQAPEPAQPNPPVPPPNPPPGGKRPPHEPVNVVEEEEEAPGPARPQGPNDLDLPVRPPTIEPPRPVDKRIPGWLELPGTPPAR